VTKKIIFCDCTRGNLRVKIWGALVSQKDSAEKSEIIVSPVKYTIHFNRALRIPNNHPRFGKLFSVK